MNNDEYRLWEATLKNGKKVNALDGTKWDDICSDVKSLQYVVTGKFCIKLPENLSYVQATTCSANLFSGECEIESRYIGYIENGKKTLFRINEKTNEITIETQKA